jgi:hypothetical protein
MEGSRSASKAGVKPTTIAAKGVDNERESLISTEYQRH